MLLANKSAIATHIVGGSCSYRFINGALFGGLYAQQYEITFNIYEDCLNGHPSSISGDNPIFLAFYGMTDSFTIFDSSIYYSSRILSPLNYDSSCISVPPNICIWKTTFIKSYYLFSSSTGYTIVNQRCCRSMLPANLFNPGSSGFTYYCKIPPTAFTDSNTAPIFNDNTGKLLCLNTPFTLNCGATEPDGDSLSYYLAPALNGTSAANPYPKPVPLPPPYDSLAYLSPYNSQYPMPSTPAIHIDPVTGILSGTPTLVGYYLVNIGCVEWRNHVPMDTVHNEFNLIVSYRDNAVPIVPASTNNKIQISPNPGNEIFDLQIQLDNSEYTSAKITDCMGRTILTVLDNQQLQAGYNNFQFGLPLKGIYFLRVRINKVEQVFKVVKI